MVERLPANWPAGLRYTNSQVWERVPLELHALRKRLIDVGAVSRPYKLQIVTVTERSHPCFGERSLVAGEDVPAGARLCEYAGDIHVEIAQRGGERASEFNRSSYLLNLYTNEDEGVYIDIDAADAGNEARFVNDHNGTGASRQRRAPEHARAHALSCAPSPWPARAPLRRQAAQRDVLAVRRPGDGREAHVRQDDRARARG